MAIGKKAERNITKNAKGEYYVCYYYDANNKTYEKCNNLTDARKKLKIFEADKLQNKTVTPLKDTIAQELDYYVSTIKTINCRSNTMKFYRNIANNHLKPILGSIKLQDLKVSDVNKYIATKQSEGLKDITVNKHIVLLKATIRNAKKEKKIAEDILEHFSNVRFRDYKHIVNSESEIKTLLNLIRGTHLEVPIYILTFTGIRASEMNGLTWDCVDFKNNKIWINKARVQIGKIAETSDTKTPESYRGLKISPVLSEMLKREKRKQDETKELLGNRWGISETNEYDNNDLDYVFVKEDGSLYRPDYLSRALVKFCKQQNINKINVHGLRHAAATYLLKSEDMTIVDVQKLLGHSKASTTLNIYTHATDKHSERASKNLAKLYGMEEDNPIDSHQNEVC